MPLALGPQEQTSLVERLCSGDTAAEEELYRTFVARLKAIFRCWGCGDTAAELAHDTLMVAIQAARAGKIRATDRLAAFLHGTARNLARNQRRTSARLPIAQPLEAAGEIAASRYDDEEERREELVRRALEELGDSDRRILSAVLNEGKQP